MTDAQFAALAKLLRLRAGSTSDVVRLVLVDGLSVPDAARTAGLEYIYASRAVKRARDALELVRIAAG